MREMVVNVQKSQCYNKWAYTVKYTIYHGLSSV